MGKKTEELIKTLDELALLLESDGESHWKKWMLKAKNSLLKSDYSGIEYLLSAYGGMGSFNDLVIGQSIENGKFTWKPSYQENNDKLDYLRSKAYKLADDIKRNHEIKTA